MTSEKDLEKIISEIDEASLDKAASGIFKMSAKMKEKMRLVKDSNEIELYYLSMLPDNEDYLKKIKNMQLNEMEALYAALNHPILFADLDGKKLDYFSEEFKGLDPVYGIKEREINGTEAKKISKLYSMSESVDSKQDLKYAEMYDVSYKIKQGGVKVIMNANETGFEFYLVDLSALGNDGNKIIDYLSGLKNDDASYFASVSNDFSIIDMDKKILYTMKSSTDKNGKETIKMSKHENKEEEYGFMYKLMGLAKQNPKVKVLFVNKPEEETYHTDSKPPSDMYA
jgi:hypothetical protein